MKTMPEQNKKRLVLGSCIIGLLILAALICNGFWSSVASKVVTDARWAMPLVYTMIGVIIAQPIIMAIWLTLGSGKAWVRAIVSVLLGLLFVGAWYLSLDLDRTEHAFFRDGYFLISFLPVNFACCTIPMLVARYVGMRRFTSLNFSDENIDRLTIVDMMAGMALIGLAISAARLGWNYADNLGHVRNAFVLKEMLIGILIACGVSYLTGILATLACILAARVSLLNDALILFSALLAATLIFASVFIGFGATIDWGMLASISTIVASVVISVLLFVRALAMMGYRLKKFVGPRKISDATSAKAVS